jgi:hypothetical protein
MNEPVIYLITVKARTNDFNLILDEFDNEDDLYLKMTDLDLSGKEYQAFKSYTPRSRKVRL